MRSLRTQLLLGTALGTTAVLVLSGVALYALISRTLWSRFDESLADKARSLTALVELDHGQLEFELTEYSLPEFEPAENAEYYQLWAPDGTVGARSPSLAGGDLNRVTGPPGVPAFQTAPLPTGRPGRVVGLTFTPRQDGGAGAPDADVKVTLVVGREVAGIQATLARVRGLLIGVGAVAVLLSAGVLAGMVRRGLSPIDRLTSQIAAVGEDDLSARIDDAGVPSEILPVVDRLNDLLSRVSRAFQRERRFTGDVAHELRTPLAGLRAKMETALSCERAPDAYRDTIGDCLAISLDMQRIVENLLHLARADAGQLEVRSETIDLPELLRAGWKPWQDQAATRGLTEQWQLVEPCLVESDRDVLGLALHNIFSNAVTYANDNGRVGISLVEEAGDVVLAVENTGAALAAADTPHVFDRFWRGDAARSPCGTHYGLGLPICKVAIERLGGTIAASIAQGDVFTVTIRLPRNKP